MSKKSVYGLIIALAIPIACYLWLKSASDNAVIMPRHYLLDTVIEQVVNGKQKSDSIWHTTGNLQLVNQLGDTVHLYDQAGKIIILDLFFTSCGSICPKLTKNMSKLQGSFTRGGDIRKKVDTSIVHFMSISVDPNRDSVPVLRAYANKTGVISDNWWLLTGNRDSIYKFAYEELKVDNLPLISMAEIATTMFPSVKVEFEEIQDLIHGRYVRKTHEPAETIALIDKKPSLVALAHGDGVMLKPQIVFATGISGV